jgi:hypothetical protein
LTKTPYVDERTAVRSAADEHVRESAAGEDYSVSFDIIWHRVYCRMLKAGYEGDRDAPVA